MSAVTLASEPDGAALLLAAEQATGLSDFGDNWSRQSLDNVVAFLNGDAALAPVQRAAAYQQLVNVLSGRLRLIADRRRYPGIEQEQIDAPIIVMGFGRSGTTFLHSLIAEDPANRAPAYWEVARPSPPPSLAGPDDPRIDAGHLDIKAWLDGIPGFITQHPYWDQGALALMECESFYVYNLSHHYPIQESQIPFRTKWAVDVDERTKYEFHRSFLQQLQYGGPPPRWALKGVDHQFYLTGLCAVYPDARLVWAHRDPVQVMGSLPEVTLLLTDGTGGDTADRTAFAHAWLNRHRTNLDKAMSGGDGERHAASRRVAGHRPSEHAGRQRHRTCAVCKPPELPARRTGQRARIRHRLLDVRRSACPAREGARVNGAEWSVTSVDGELYLSTAEPRAHQLDHERVHVRGTVLTDTCACGRDGPRVHVDPSRAI